MDERLPWGTKVRLMNADIGERVGVVTEIPAKWSKFFGPTDYLIVIGDNNLVPYIGTTDPSVTKANPNAHYIQPVT